MGDGLLKKTTAFEVSVHARQGEEKPSSNPAVPICEARPAKRRQEVEAEIEKKKEKKKKVAPDSTPARKSGSDLLPS